MFTYGPTWGVERQMQASDNLEYQLFCFVFDKEKIQQLH